MHGHFLRDAFDSVVPRPRFMTWVRHPVDRVVSNYYHGLRSPDLRDDCCRRLHKEKLSLRAFAELDWMQNLATRYLAGKAIEAFDFVGIAERSDESRPLLGRAFGWATPPCGPRENTNPDRVTPSCLTSAAGSASQNVQSKLPQSFGRRLDRLQTGGKHTLTTVGPFKRGADAGHLRHGSGGSLSIEPLHIALLADRQSRIGMNP